MASKNDFIFKTDDKFVIKREFNGKIYEFGTFDDLNDAIKKRDELDYEGWPTPINEKSYDQIENNIRKDSDSDYVVFRELDGEIIEYGHYDSLFAARKARYEFKSSGWKQKNKKSNIEAKYGKYISKVQNGFRVQKRINGKLRVFGYFNTLNEATKARNKFVSENWKNNPYNSYKTSSHDEEDKYIYKVGNKFKIMKSIDGVNTVFGYYDSLEEARKFRDRFESENWVNNLYISGRKTPLDNVNRYIFRNGKRFGIQKSIDGVNTVFGYYDSLEEARKFRDRFESENWVNNPHEEEFLKNRKDRYIHKIGDKYYVYKNVNNDILTFGEFESYEDAKLKLNYLIENDWVDEEPSVEIIDSEEDFIKFDGQYYTIEKPINSNNYVYGVFKNEDLAIKERDKLIKNNWDGLSRIKNDEHPYGLNIRPFDYIFFVDTDDGEELGPFYSFADSVKVCNELENELNVNLDDDQLLVTENNHDLDYSPLEKNVPENTKDDNKNESKIIAEKENSLIFEDKFINYDGRFYTVERFFDSKYHVYGVFKTKHSAIKKRDDLIKNNWMGINSVKSEKYLYGENIVILNGFFFIEIKDKGLSDFGPFYKYEDAVKKCNELKNELSPHENDAEIIDNGENEVNTLKISFDDILNIYNNINLVEEKPIPFPQANLIGELFEICEKVYDSGYLTPKNAKEIFSLRDRQYSFYKSAGLYLGLFEDSQKLMLTEKGKQIFSFDEKEKYLAITGLILEHKPFYDVFKAYLDNKRYLNHNEIFDILKNENLYNIKSDVTIKRRASAVKNWIEWILNLYD